MSVRRFSIAMSLILLLMSVNAPSVAEAVPPDDWPMYAGDSRHTGASAVDGPTSAGSYQWQYDFHEPVTGPVVGPDGVAYVSGESGLFAINPDGTLKWKRTRDSFPGNPSPAIGPTGIYEPVNSFFDGYRLDAVDSATGAFLWSYPIGRTSYGSPTVDPDGVIYIGNAPSSGTSTFYAINPNGSLKWSWDSGSSGGIESSAAIAVDGTVYFQHNLLGLIALDSSGGFEWSRADLGDAWNSPSVDTSGTIYIGDSDHKFYAVNPDGTTKWSVPVEAFMYVSSASIAADESTIVRGDNAGTLYAFNANGTEKWQYPVVASGGPIISAPALSANGLAYFLHDDAVVAVRVADGSLAWSYDIGGPATWASDTGVSPALAAGGLLYALGSHSSTHSVLFAFKDQPPAIAGNQLSAVALGSEIALFGRSPANDLWYRETTGGVFGGWTLVDTSSSVAGRPRTVVRPDGDLYVFFRGPANDLRYAVRDGGGASWSSGILGGTIAGDPVVAVDGTGDIVVVVTGPSGDLWYRRLPSGSDIFGAWANTDGAFPSFETTLVEHSGDLFLFGLDVGGGAWTRTWDGDTDSWGSWTNLGGYIESTELGGVSHGGELQFIVLGGGGALYYRTYTGAAWGSWQAMDGQLTGTLRAVSTGGELLAAGVNSAGASWSRTSADGSTWDPWDGMGGVVASTPELVATSGGAYYFAQTADGGVWFRKWNGATWDPWSLLGGSLALE